MEAQWKRGILLALGTLDVKNRTGAQWRLRCCIWGESGYSKDANLTIMVLFRVRMMMVANRKAPKQEKQGRNQSSCFANAL